MGGNRKKILARPLPVLSVQCARTDRWATQRVRPDGELERPRGMLETPPASALDTTGRAGGQRQPRWRLNESLPPWRSEQRAWRAQSKEDPCTASPRLTTSPQRWSTEQPLTDDGERRRPRDHGPTNQPARREERRRPTNQPAEGRRGRRGASASQRFPCATVGLQRSPAAPPGARADTCYPASDPGGKWGAERSRKANESPNP